MAVVNKTIPHQGEVEAVIEAKTASLTGATTATTAQLAALTSTVNTVAKKTGKPVFNTTTGALVVAVGGAAGSVWNTAAGVLAHTPV